MWRECLHTFQINVGFPLQKSAISKEEEGEENKLVDASEIFLLQKNNVPQYFAVK